MTVEGKNIEGLNAEDPVSVAAKRALEVRTKAVWKLAPLAAKKKDKNTEYVHQLRVSTRRARSALEMFRDLLPKGKAKRMKKRLRKLRLAAGEARDLDVLAKRVEQADSEEKGQLADVLKRLRKRRDKAQKPLVRAYRKAKRDGFSKQARRLTKAVRRKGKKREPTFGESARSKLSPIVGEFLAAGEADLSSLPALHELRIRGKQVRYSLELLAGAFEESAFEEAYSTLEEVQDRLGTVNDHSTAIDTLKDLFDRTKNEKGKDARSGLIEGEEKQLAESAEAFRQWWTTKRISAFRQCFESLTKPEPEAEADPSQEEPAEEQQETAESASPAESENAEADSSSETPSQ